MPLQITAVAAICLVLLVLFFAIKTPLRNAKKRLGLDSLNQVIFFLILTLWIALFLTLTAGLLYTLWHIILSTPPVADSAALVDDPENSTELWDWRFELTKLTALTGVLGAVVALPFTLIRLDLMRKQTKHTADSLFNEKIEAALTSLYATRQVTERYEDFDGRESTRDVHEDDIVRRNAAIDALENLAKEPPFEVVRITRIISVYVREISRAFPLEEIPPTRLVREFHAWLNALEPARSDLRSAVQAIGRLRPLLASSFLEDAVELRGAHLCRVELNARDLDFRNVNFKEAQLRYANMQGAHFEEAIFHRAEMQGAILKAAHLQGANFIEAQLEYADLEGALLQEAKLMDAALERANLIDAQLQGASLDKARLAPARLMDAQLQGASLVNARLQGANLQGANLQGANLMEAGLEDARLRGVFLDQTKLDPIQFHSSTPLSGNGLRAAALRRMDFSQISNFSIDLDDVFGDSTVVFPEGIKIPEHFHRSYKTEKEFISAWRAFQKEIGFDPDDPSTWDKPKD